MAGDGQRAELVELEAVRRAVAVAVAPGRAIVDRHAVGVGVRAGRGRRQGRGVLVVGVAGVAWVHGRVGPEKARRRRLRIDARAAETDLALQLGARPAAGAVGDVEAAVDRLGGGAGQRRGARRRLEVAPADGERGGGDGERARRGEAVRRAVRVAVGPRSRRRRARSGRHQEFKLDAAGTLGKAARGGRHCRSGGSHDTFAGGRELPRAGSCLHGAGLQLGAHGGCAPGALARGQGPARDGRRFLAGDARPWRHRRRRGRQARPHRPRDRQV